MRKQNSALLSFFCFLQVIFFADAKSDILVASQQSDIEALRLQWYFIRLVNSRSEYHSAQAEYHCEAIELAQGE